jgi:hypothetical protein
LGSPWFELLPCDGEGFYGGGESLVGIGRLGVEQVANAHLDISVGVTYLSKYDRKGFLVVAKIEEPFCGDETNIERGVAKAFP